MEIHNILLAHAHADKHLSVQRTCSACQCNALVAVRAQIQDYKSKYPGAHIVACTNTTKRHRELEAVGAGMKRHRELEAVGAGLGFRV